MASRVIWTKYFHCKGTLLFIQICGHFEATLPKNEGHTELLILTASITKTLQTRNQWDLSIIFVPTAYISCISTVHVSTLAGCSCWVHQLAPQFPQVSQVSQVPNVKWKKRNTAMETTEAAAADFMSTTWKGEHIRRWGV